MIYFLIGCRKSQESFGTVMNELSCEDRENTCARYSILCSLDSCTLSPGLSCLLISTISFEFVVLSVYGLRSDRFDLTSLLNINMNIKFQ